MRLAPGTAAEQTRCRGTRKHDASQARHFRGSGNPEVCPMNDARPPMGTLESSIVPEHSTITSVHRDGKLPVRVRLFFLSMDTRPDVPMP